MRCLSARSVPGGKLTFNLDELLSLNDIGMVSNGAMSVNQGQIYSDLRHEYESADSYLVHSLPPDTGAEGQGVP